MLPKQRYENIVCKKKNFANKKIQKVIQAEYYASFLIDINFFCGKVDCLFSNSYVWEK